jgi:cobalt-zinc-cadmium efflux system protein
MILIFGSSSILNKALPRIFNPDLVNHDGMFLFAVVGITVNGIAV